MQAPWAVSLCAIPAVVKSGAPSNVMLKQWSIVYNNGKAIPLTALIAAISYGVVSFNQRSRYSPRWKGFALASILTVAAIPFTMIFMMATNNELDGAAHSHVKTLSDDRFRTLITKWVRLNTIRLSLPLSGAIIGLWTLLA